MKTYFLAMACTGMGLSVLALCYLALLPLLGRRYGPRGLYRVWVVVLAGLLIPFSLLASRPLMTVELPRALSRSVASDAATVAPLAAASQTMDAVQVSSAAQTSQPFRGTQEAYVENMTETAVAYLPQAAAEREQSASASAVISVDWLSVLAWVWLAGAAAVLALAAVSHLRFARTVRRWQMSCEAEGYAAVLQTCLSEMNIRRRVSLRLCPTVSSPMLMGLLHPVILLPDEELTTDELALVLRHELTHLKRGDLWVKAGLVLAYALHWYNPVVWAMGRSLCFYQEASCDSHVTARADEEERRFYSETILRVIRRQARTRTALCTSFYGGRNGMKRRIIAIMEGRRRTGAVLGVLALVLTAVLGGALAMVEDDSPALPLNAWVHAAEGTGTILLTGPSANDVNCPMGIYLNGTPVTVVELRESSALPEWNSVEGEPNWARVLIAGDGDTSGIPGWMPLRDLVYEKPSDALPAATLAAGEESGFTTLYTLNHRESDVAAVERDGSGVTVLGQLDYWLHVSLEGEGMFMLLEDATLSDEADALLYDLLPDRFDGITRIQYDNDRNLNRLLESMYEKYGRNVPLEFWSLEDKARYGQLEEMYLGSHDHYYILPGEDDLPLEEAGQIALEAYAETFGGDAVSADEVDLYPGFYRLGQSEAVYWSFYICEKDTHNVLWHVELDGKTGEPRG
ncbi:MAG: M56 family metallopeptidase [Clostridiales bacterium]|nr:M56 family metallopeptidase [Clostridiales bacterium]